MAEEHKPKSWAERSAELLAQAKGKASSSVSAAPQVAVREAAKADVAVEAKPYGIPHPGAAPSGGSADDPTGAKFVAWVKADMAYKQSQH